MQDIDLKTLVYEAYQKGAQELLYVVPFTAKVLEACAKSTVSTMYIFVMELVWIYWFGGEKKSAIWMSLPIR